MSNATATVVECPKCFGVDELRHFRNIHNGTCFLCAGAGTCTETAWFDVRGGRVLVSMVVNGLVRRQGELQAALQGALKR